MKINLTVILCLTALALQGCNKPMARAPALPPISYGTTVSRPAAAIENTETLQSMDKQ